MKLIRTFDAKFINSVVNHPEVKESAGVPDAEEVDVGPMLQDVRNVCLVTPGGGFLLFWKAPATYELHTQFLPEARGAEPLKAVEQAFFYMFINTDCMTINTKVHKDNTGAISITKIYSELISEHGDYLYFSLTFDSWVRRSNKCRIRGEEFHDSLGEDKSHDDDSGHDSQAGAAILMAESGNHDKCEFIYNRWAMSAGYEPIVIQSRQPAIIKIGDLMMSLQHSFELGVEKCQLGQ